MVIPYNIKSGGFRDTVSQVLQNSKDLIRTFQEIEIELDADTPGYPGDVEVSIQPSNDEGFKVSGWSGKDPTRFPARIRAVATAIKDNGHKGDFRIQHKDGVIKIQKIEAQPTEPVIFGEVPGVKPGDMFADRRALHDANVHRGLIQGIAARGSAIVLNEGYVDDEDLGDEIIYTGQGGQKNQIQVADQTFISGVKYLAKHYAEGTPIRVSRGPELKSPYAPTKCYQYAGLYRIDHYWREKGVHGFLIYRYRLLRIDGQGSNAARGSKGESSASLPEGNPNPKRIMTTTQRVVRSTKVGKSVKDLYGYTCQMCGSRLETKTGPYAECCHIKPLGKPHDGPDIMENVLCLCPNCHVLFDHHAITIDDDLFISQLDANLNMVPDHKLDLEYVRYRRDSVHAD